MTGHTSLLLGGITVLLLGYASAKALDQNAPIDRRSTPIPLFDESDVTVTELHPRRSDLDTLNATDFDVAWANYTNQTIAGAKDLGGLQSGCVPRRFKPQGGYRGLVVLFHGFGACPQAYDELGPLLAARGMDVIVPLTPGHGIKNPNGPHPTFRGPLDECPTYTCRGPLDEATNVPTNQSGYVAYVELINTIAALAQPPRAVAGLSLGGTMAAYAGQAYYDGQALYARQLMMNPFLARSQLTNPDFVWWLEYAALDDQWVGFDTPEEKVCQDEQAQGRAGYCSLQVKHVRAITVFAESTTLAQLNAPADTSVAVIYVQEDPTVSTIATRTLADSYETQVTEGSVQRCVLNFTEHAMLSKWSTPGLNRWWSNELACDITNYLSRDIPFRISSAVNPTEGNENYCHLGCTAESCPYNFTAPLTCPTANPTPTPTANPTPTPTSNPTANPTGDPTQVVTRDPTQDPCDKCIAKHPSMRRRKKKCTKAKKKCKPLCKDNTISGLDSGWCNLNTHESYVTRAAGEKFCNNEHFKNKCKKSCLLRCM